MRDPTSSPGIRFQLATGRAGERVRFVYSRRVRGGAEPARPRRPKLHAVQHGWVRRARRLPVELRRRIEAFASPGCSGRPTSCSRQRLRRTSRLSSHGCERRAGRPGRVPVPAAVLGPRRRARPRAAAARRRARARARVASRCTAVNASSRSASSTRRASCRKRSCR